jgi:hypothetical protein
MVKNQLNLEYTIQFFEGSILPVNNDLVGKAKPVSKM